MAMLAARRASGRVSLKETGGIPGQQRTGCRTSLLRLIAGMRRRSTRSAASRGQCFSSLRLLAARGLPAASPRVLWSRGGLAVPTATTCSTSGDFGDG